MAQGPPIPLTVTKADVNSPDFRAICGWPFADAYIARLLRQDVPRRMTFGNCFFWTYRDPGGSLVGFGTLDVAEDCGAYTGGKLHPYIPLLAVNPTIKNKGYGTSIVRHLIGEAALLTAAGVCHDVLFLDVYVDNKKAIEIYASLGFEEISPTAVPDPAENGRPFIVMGQRVSI